MFEIVIIQRGPTHWEWEVRNCEGLLIVQGWEKTRAEASYQGNRALFSVLASEPVKHQPAETLLNIQIFRRFLAPVRDDIEGHLGAFS